MSLTHKDSVDIGTSINSACGRGTTDEIVLVDGSADVSRLDLSDSSAPGTPIDLGYSATQVRLCSVGDDVVVAFDSNSQNVSFIDLVGETVDTESSVGFLSAATHQLCAGSASLELAFGCCATAGNVMRADANAGTAAKVVLKDLGTDVAYSIIQKDNDHFIIGTDTGQIIEFDASVNPPVCTNKYALQLDIDIFSAIAETPRITGLSYFRGLLLAVTKFGLAYLFHHESGQLLQRTYLPDSPLSEADNGCCFLGVSQANAYNHITEFDFAITPMRVRSRFLINSNTAITRCGAQGSYAWGIRGNFIQICDYSAKSTVGQSASLVDTDPIEGDVLFLNVDSGLDQADLILHTRLKAGGEVVNLPPSTDILQLGWYKQGVNTKFKASRYTSDS